jgi:serine-type D-Ala-D-Ala endopeptidase (penicillin-binding protein 7)
MRLIQIAAGVLLCATSLVATAAESVWLYNITQDRVVTNIAADRVRPMASITKLMTALVALDHDPDLTRRLRLVTPLSSYLPRRSYTRGQLLEAVLIKSDNAAAETLAHDYPGGRTAFIAAMNDRARAMRLYNTRFADASGLSSGNVSTAAELALLIRVAAGNSTIRDTAGMHSARITVEQNKRTTTLNLNHTSLSLLTQFGNILASKTGLTTPAGWCVALLVQQDDQDWVMVILGSRTRDQRAQTVQQLMHNHVMPHQWPAANVNTVRSNQP